MTAGQGPERARPATEEEHRSMAFEVDGLIKTFPVQQTLFDRIKRAPRLAVRALDGVTLRVEPGETLGIVGESGCGKSTLARCLVRLHEPDAGSVRYHGTDVLALQGERLRRYHRKVQMIFQDPYSSLNPRMSVGQILREALGVHAMRPAKAIPGRMRELLDMVGLPADAADRMPHEFSGGQRQRIGIARALALEPETLVADELVSALDVSVQAQVINLLLELQERLHLTVLFVAHDLRLVRHISHRVAVMYLGRVVEVGETEALFRDPRHPYTRALLSAAPSLDPELTTTTDAVRGELPSPLHVPGGCAFHPRCSRAFEGCDVHVPELVARDGRECACHLFAPDRAGADAFAPHGPTGPKGPANELEGPAGARP